MSHTFLLSSFRIQGYESDDKDFCQCTVSYEIDGEKFLTTTTGDDPASAVANVCLKVSQRRNVPLTTVIGVIIPVALEAVADIENQRMDGDID